MTAKPIYVVSEYLYGCCGERSRPVSWTRDEPVADAEARRIGGKVDEVDPVGSAAQREALTQAVADAAIAWLAATCDHPDSCGDGLTYHGHDCATIEAERVLVDAVDALRKLGT